ncbi:MAG TPA: glycosyltransferase family 4 protein [Pirellulaceae bacterium]|nr:glycosyltransferase family 4 protein [Pirellulaceae bacterium]
MMRILHMTPHLGGGVGRVICNYIAHSHRNEELEHRLICLEPVGQQTHDWAQAEQVLLFDDMWSQIPALMSQVARADVVLVHWWNHPLLMDLLVRQQLPPARLLMWSHVAGYSAPQVFSPALVSLPDLFVVATPYSYHAPTFEQSPELLESVRLVFTCAGLEHISHRPSPPHAGFRIGYVGTVDPCKLHPDFLRISAAADIPNAEFVVCGGDRHLQWAALAEKQGLSDRFRFLGNVTDVAEQLATFDVFGYPLQRQHYGTGEQVLIEAMGAGVPPVVLGPGAESYVVQHEVTGLVAESTEDYARGLERLWRDSRLRQQLGNQARQAALSEFTIEKTAAAWYEVFEEARGLPKRPHRWATEHTVNSKISDAELFMISLGQQGDAFREDGAKGERIASLPYFFRTRTRGTPFHYRRFFPDDPRLRDWCRILSQETPPDAPTETRLLSDAA